MNPSRKPELFTESQTNHLVGTFRHVDHLLELIEAAVTDSRGGLFPGDVQDLNAERKREILAFVAELRDRMAEKMKKYNLELPPPKTTASHAAASALSFIGIAFDDLRPSEMRGYGQVSENAAAELQDMIHELQSLTTAALRSLKRRGEGVAS